MSLLGEGATFDFYLPAFVQEIVEEAPESDRHDIQYGQDTIHLVDDQAIIIT